MSMPFLIFSCSDCEYSGNSTVAWGQFMYQCEAGQVPVHRILAWCVSCRDIAPVEVLPDGTEIDRLVSDIEIKEQQIRQHMTDAERNRSLLAKLLRLSPRLAPEVQMLSFEIERLQDGLQMARDRRALLSGRTSEPRCLRCGTQHYLALPDFRLADTDERPGPPMEIGMRHPQCSGSLLVAHSPFSVSIALPLRLYDPNGRFVREVDAG